MVIIMESGFSSWTHKLFTDLGQNTECMKFVSTATAIITNADLKI